MDLLCEKTYIPSLEWVIGHLEYQPDTVPTQLQRIARTANGISARTLRALPFSALVGHIIHEPCHMYELLEALRFEIEKEKGIRNGSRLLVADTVEDREPNLTDEDSDSGGCTVIENYLALAKESVDDVQELVK